MAGELWREVVQVGKESSYGVDAAATRKLYLMNVKVDDKPESRPKEFATGSVDAVRAHTLGPSIVDGSAEVSMSADELLEWLECMFGAATVSTPGGGTLSRDHTYKPSAASSSMVLERNDGAIARQALGVMVNQMKIAGSVEKDNQATFDFICSDLQDAALTGSLTDRVPTFMEGWQTNFYLQAFGSAPPGSQISDALISWEVTVNRNLTRKRWAKNDRATHGLRAGKIAINASLTLEASASQTATELANYLAQTKRVATLEFLGPADEIETGFRRTVTINLPGSWSTRDYSGADNGTRVYQFGLQYVYEPTSLAAGLKIVCRNARTAAFS